MDAVQDPAYSTAVGLMELDMLIGNADVEQQPGQPTEGVFGMVSGLLKKFKK
jgi:hypothetical protein